MPIVMRDMVMETSTTTGTGTMSLAGAAAGFATFRSQFADGDQCYYAIHQTGGAWEVGLGTVHYGTPDTFARTSVMDSSAAGAAVNWGAGTKSVICTLPAGVSMVGGNNLSEVASAATARANLGLGAAATVALPLVVANGGTGANTVASARTALGLGTAAVLDVGTAALKVVQMDAAAKLPAVDGSQLTNVVGSVPAGTKMLFMQAAAPTGWTQVVTWNDKVIRVVSGAGAGTGGSWTISGISVDAHTLTVSELATHSHGIPVSLNMSVASGAPFVNIWADGATTKSTNAEGSDVPHAHNLTIGSAWRPAYVDAIVCSKN